MTDTLQEVKRKLDIVKEVSKHVKLEASGDRYVGFCPFHPNVNTPALTIYPDQQSWWCYGCNVGGDVLDFLSKAENQTLAETIRNRAMELGVSLRNLSPKERKILEKKKRLYSVLNEAAALYRSMLTSSSHGDKARRYLIKRGLNEETMERFQLGYSIDSFEQLTSWLISRGFDQQDLIDAGLTREVTTGLMDFFRDRIMFPIRANGHVLGFGARAMQGLTAKYINSPTTAVFKKRNLVYGLPQAVHSIRSQEYVVLVEGYMDVLGLHQAGFTNTVGIMGISLTDDQARLLTKYTSKAILALDPDEAAEIALARLQVERHSNLDLYIASLPGQQDPDELVRSDRDLWYEVIDSAQPIPVYMTDYLIRKKQPKDAKDRRSIVQQVLKLIDQVKDPYEQAEYQGYLARSLGTVNFTPQPACPHCGKRFIGDKHD